MLHKLFFDSSVYKNITNENNREGFKIEPKYMGHHIIKASWALVSPNDITKELIMATNSPKCCLRDILMP